MGVKPFVAEAVHDASRWRGYSTAMVTTQRPKKPRAKTAAKRQKWLFIKEHMDANNVSDDKAAKEIGVARETVYRWHTEQWRLDPGKIAQLAKAVGIKPGEFYSPPGRRSLDAIVQDAPDEVHEMAVDIVERLVKKAS